MKNFCLVILFTSMIRLCFHFPSMIIWVLFAILMYMMIRPILTIIKNNINDKED